MHQEYSSWTSNHARAAAPYNSYIKEYAQPDTGHVHGKIENGQHKAAVSQNAAN